MKNMFKFSSFALLAVCLFAGNAYATDGDVYRDPYTSQNEDGLWTFTNYKSDGYKKTVHVIATSSNTPSSVTAARTGNTWILTGTGGAVGGVGYTLTLPTAASGLIYTFSTSTAQSLSVRAATSTDLMLWGNNVGKTRFTSPASTGSTITVVGATNRWYVTQMDTPVSGSPANGHDDWTGGTL